MPPEAVPPAVGSPAPRGAAAGPQNLRPRSAIRRDFSGEVQEQLARQIGPAAAEALPRGFQRVGSVVLLRLPPTMRSVYPIVGELYRSRLGATAVLNWSGPVEGEARRPRVELVAGSSTVTEVREYGIRYALDAAQLLFSRGNRTERHRAGLLTCPGDRVVDLFAGIGYFALPAAQLGRAREVVAVEKNPVAFDFLCRNVVLNGLEGRVRPILGDNREVELPRGWADRVFLGYLPTAEPWIPLALELLRPTGGALHVHRLANARPGGEARARSDVKRAVEVAGRTVDQVRVREVKAYGPGRAHVVVDVAVGA